MKGIQDGGLIIGTGLSISGNVFAGGIFLSVGGFAKALESTIYSSSPCNDAVIQGVQSLIEAPYGLDPISDKAIEEAMEFYIDYNKLPKK